MDFKKHALNDEFNITFETKKYLLFFIVYNNNSFIIFFYFTN